MKPSFEKPIDTEYDVLQSQMDVMVPEKSAIATLISIDPRPSVQMLEKHVKLYRTRQDGNFDQHVEEG